MKERKAGSTSITEYFNLVDKTAGTAKTGVAMANLYLTYTRTQKSAVASVCSSLSSSAAAFSSYGASEVDATNAPGLYRVDIPDAAWSTGADTVILTLNATTTSSAAPSMKEVLLVANTSSDNYSLITAGVKAVTVVGNVGGSVGSVVGNVGGSVASVVGNVGGLVAGSVGSVIGNVGGSVASVTNTVTANVTSLSSAALGDFFDTSTGATAGAAVAGSVVFEIVNNAGGSGLTAASIADAVWDESTGGHVGTGTFGLRIPNVGSVSGNVGGSVGSVVGNVGGSVGSVVGNVGGLVAGSVGSVVGNVGGSVASVTGNVGGSVASVLGNVGSVTGGVAGSVGSVVGNVGGSVGSVVGNVGGQVSAVGSAVTVGTNNDKTGYVLSAIGSAALTEDYAADGATGTLNQMLYMILQNLGDFSITGTVRTVNKLDGATTAMQYSLNSSTAPTATTRAL